MARFRARPALLTAEKSADAVDIDDGGLRRRLEFAIGSAPVEGPGATAVLEAKRACRLRAFSAFVMLSEVRAKTREGLEDGKVDEQSAAVAEGRFRALPIVAEWWAPDRTCVWVMYGRVTDL